MKWHIVESTAIVFSIRCYYPVRLLQIGNPYRMSDNYKLDCIHTKQDWDQWLRKCREVDLQQTWEYGESVKRCIGWEPDRRLVLEGGVPVAMVQTLIKDVPILGRVARMQHGPLFLENEVSFSSSRAIQAIDFLRGYWVEEEKVILHLAPCLLAGDLPVDWAEKTGFKSTNEPVWASIRMDLRLDEETLHSHLKRKWRAPLQKAEKAGLEAVWSQSESDFEWTLEKYRRQTVEKGISWPSAELTQGLWNEAKESMRMVFAEKDGERVGVLLSIAYVDSAFGLLIWESPHSRTLHAHNFLDWRSILYYQELGYRWFDLGGIDPENLPGITKFKRGTGGQEYTLSGAFEARPSGAGTGRISGEDDLGHVLTGLRLPGQSQETGADVEDQVEALLIKFVQDTTGFDIGKDTSQSLIESGLIDSLSIISLVQALQETFDIEISFQDLTLENFDRLQLICELVQAKMVNR